jgi:hypothetical protein
MKAISEWLALQGLWHRDPKRQEKSAHNAKSAERA